MQPGSQERGELPGGFGRAAPFNQDRSPRSLENLVLRGHYDDLTSVVELSNMLMTANSALVTELR